MERMMEYRLSDIEVAANWFWRHIGDHSVFAFHGEMGAGKTTFIKTLCHVKKVTDVVTSPSFSLVNEYRLPNNESIFHIDLYRLRDEDEARMAGIDDILFGGSLCFVEWPDRAPGIFPQHTLHVHLVSHPDTTRQIKLGSPSEV